MREKIVQALEAEAAKRDCRILFAVESGSRAWGFASPDSDYDVRAVYVKNLDSYLGLEESKADTWEAMLPDEIDLAAWDLRKALRQMLRCNCSLLEWIGSPIVYADAGILSRLAEFGRRTFNPKHAAFHYASLFRHAIADRGDDGRIRVKKLCYALRANAAVRWVLERETMPPTGFQELLAGIKISDELRGAIGDLIRLKAVAAEKDRILPDPALSELLVDRFDEVGRLKDRPPAESPGDLRAELEREFRAWVGR